MHLTEKMSVENAIPNPQDLAQNKTEQNNIQHLLLSTSLQPPKDFFKHKLGVSIRKLNHIYMIFLPLDIPVSVQEHYDSNFLVSSNSIVPREKKKKRKICKLRDCLLLNLVIHSL